MSIWNIRPKMKQKTVRGWNADLEKVLDLTDLDGYGRLYASPRFMETKGGWLKGLLYDAYLNNLNACLAQGTPVQGAVSRDRFLSEILRSTFRPYRTNIQLCKAVDLLQWNLRDDGTADADWVIQRVSDLAKDVLQTYRHTREVSPRSPLTSYCLCEDSLNPVWEPESEMNPTAFQKLEPSKPQMVYICAPLRGDLEKNIAFAAEKAREVFRQGDIPICPHLLFPPVADPNDPKEDRVAIAMGLKLLEHCHRVNVYGPVWTEGMWGEIHHAEKLKIPVYTDQKELGKSPHKQNLNKKGKKHGKNQNR